MADAKPDKIVRLPPDRWRALVEHVRVVFRDQNPGAEIAVYEPTDVSGIMFLPALYRSA